jgi:hypothetical protein
MCIQRGAKFLATNPDANIIVGGYRMPAGGCSAQSIAYVMHYP